MAFFIGLLIGLVVGGGLVWGFRGWIQHRKDRVAAEVKGGAVAAANKLSK